MTPNSLPSENLAVLATLDPASVAASTVLSGAVDMSKFEQLLVLIKTGVLGASATVDAKLTQATTSGGTYKDIPSKAITQIVKASGDNKQVWINLRPEQMDQANGYRYVKLSVTVGTAASILDATILGVYPRQGTATDSSQAGLVQTVS